ncbi:EthD family reductase [Flavobacterium sp. NRK1]|uniref:EthD family reductase n=1 Tax=Flavobacterium sp. NRK1 TaxID=2954929 RepID=UPI002093DAF2|nr:EthD family reductase [Flavobacterium sp. NRK1]MCO6147940.1 EthD family reductase [Flavobacterium sp. NRK1]
MIKVLAYFKNTKGKKFDIDYYVNHHLPLIKKICGENLKNLSVDRGLFGHEPNSEPVYIIVTHFYFENLEAFQNSIVNNLNTILADSPNFTDIEPVFQISEVIL